MRENKGKQWKSFLEGRFILGLERISICGTLAAIKCKLNTTQLTGYLNTCGFFVVWGETDRKSIKTSFKEKAQGFTVRFIKPYRAPVNI